MRFNELLPGDTRSQKRVTEFGSREHKARLDALALKRIAARNSEVLGRFVDPVDVIRRLDDPDFQLLIDTLEGRVTEVLEIDVGDDENTVPGLEEPPPLERSQLAQGVTYGIGDFLHRKPDGGYEVVADVTFPDSSLLIGTPAVLNYLFQNGEKIERLFSSLPGLPESDSLTQYKGLLFDVIAHYITRGGRLGLDERDALVMSNLVGKMIQLSKVIDASGGTVSPEHVPEFQALRRDLHSFGGFLGVANWTRGQNDEQVQQNYAALIAGIENAVPPDPDHDHKVAQLREKKFLRVSDIDPDTRSVMSEIVARSLQQAYLSLGKFLDHLLVEGQKNMTSSQKSMKDFQYTFCLDDQGVLMKTVARPLQQHEHMFSEEINLARALGLVSFHGYVGAHSGARGGGPRLTNEILVKLPFFADETMGVQAHLDRIFQNKNQPDPEIWWSWIPANAVFYIRDLLRVKFFIEYYYPDNREYREILKPISDFIDVLGIIGVEISQENRIGQVLDQDELNPEFLRHNVKESKRDGSLYSYDGSDLNGAYTRFLPSVKSRIKGTIKPLYSAQPDVNHLGSMIIDIVHPGLRYRIGSSRSEFDKKPHYVLPTLGAWGHLFYRVESRSSNEH